MATFKTLSSFGNLKKTNYRVEDPLVKIEKSKKGKNIIIGNKFDEENCKNLTFLGKVSESCKSSDYFDNDVWLDTSFPHVIYITGARGTGKSFDLGVIIEGISNLNKESEIKKDVEPITSIVIDTQSQFWTLGYEPKLNKKIPENERQLNLLNNWKMESNALKDFQIFVPPNTDKFLGIEKEITIRPKDVQAEDWCALFNEEVYGPQGHIISSTLEALSGKEYEIEDIINYISDDDYWEVESEKSRNALIYKLDDYRRTNLFSAKGTKVEDLLTPKTCHILMLRELRNVDKSLLTAILSRQLFTKMGKMHSEKKKAAFFEKEYKGSDLPNKVWLFIDEAHVIAPSDSPSPGRKALREYVKRGRDAGLSLILATQQPAAIDNQILSQVNISINHRLVMEPDIAAATNRLPSKKVELMNVNGSNLNDFGSMIRLLEPGNAFISDSFTSRAFMVHIRPRISAHGGYSPS